MTVASMTEVQSLTQPEPDSGRSSPAHNLSEEPHQRDVPATQVRVPLSDSRISFAIDTSGSTLGTVLQCEQQAVRTISALLSDPAKDAARILPWSSQADQVTTVSGLSYLTSYGGTDPGVLLDAASYLAALQNSSLWFLITDGEIPEYSLQRFAQGLCLSGLHGTACVIIVFGELRGRPSNCNISVGVSVFAAAPDCLFLFKDTESDICYLMQCKGCFTEILERCKQLQPVLDDNTTWDDLPQISLNDLGCVCIPNRRNLQSNEVFLEKDLVVNLEDLFSGRITDKKLIGAILDSPENIRTITLTAQTRGLAEQLRNWVVKQELDPSDLLVPDTPKIDDKARKSMATLMQRMSSQHSFPQAEQDISKLQAELRAANFANSTALSVSRRASEAISSRRSIGISTVVDRSYSSVTHGRSISISSLEPSVEYVAVPSRSPSNWLFTPGFSKSNVSAETFEGTCPLCAQDKTTLSLLLREPPSTQVTRDFPAIGSNSKLAFPLAMGNFPETDIICPSLSCDACSYTIIQAGGNPAKDKITCVLPLVSYSGNKKAYSRQLETAFQNRFDEENTPLVFLAVLYTTLQRIETKGSANELLTSAIRWACRDIVQSVQCEDPLTWSLSKDGVPAVSKPLSDVLIKSSEDAILSISTGYFQYPIEGFVVMTMILNEMDKQTRSHIQKTAKKAVFQRLLFHITEKFDKQMDAQGRVLTHLAMAQLLILEHDRKDRTPSLQGQRKFSSFISLSGFTRSLFGDRKSLRARLTVSLNQLVTASLLDRDFLRTFRKLGPLCDWVESQSGHAVAIFLHYLYRYKIDSWTSSDEHFLKLARIPALAPVLLEPSEITPSKAEKLVERLPPFDQVGT